jgi:hypothetical protein
MALQNLRSSTANKRPVATSLSDGQIAINTNAASPGIFFKNSSNVLTKVGPIFIGTSAPNSTPAGSSGNAVGEQWLDTSGGTYALKIWDGSAWRQTTANVVGFTPYGNIAATNVQAAIQELDDEKLSTTTAASTYLAKAGGTITGNVDNTATGYFDLPSGTTAQRPGSPNAGWARFNTDTVQFEGYTGALWSSIGGGGGATGGGSDAVFFENDQTVTTNYTLTTNKNAVTAGPVTVNSGVTVTIPSGSSWVVV